MDSDYDMKFEEMKKYIPFLESMIKRLESTSTAAANPRQAQLDKIRSLRDLLLVKKKRMKMENLLKCEQVLVNLYTKVEQRDTLPGIQPASKVKTPKEKSDLNVARSKLKTVATTPHDPDTLPEIARASETEVVCVPGSKEPALFQRRPNKSSLSPTNTSSIEKSPQKSSSKRNYTRVLVSPDRSARLWSPSDGTASDAPLFSRRSPPRPSRRYSPSYHKRERKKTSKQESHTRKPKDFNITLKVPEERLDSLNTKDILSRIINCSDGDVDIATLRELRTQILGELKQTGANEDISDLILKSYKNKKRFRNKKEDVEEGELSDSESEAIESIYGNLVVVEKDKGKNTSSNKAKSSDLDEVPRKIQICLVINSDKDENPPDSTSKNSSDKQKICDITDFEMFDDNISNKSSEPVSLANSLDVFDKGAVSQKTKKPTSLLEVNLNKSQDIITVDGVHTEIEQNRRKDRGSEVIDMNNFDLQNDSNNTSVDPVIFKANFYKPLSDQTADHGKNKKPGDNFENSPTNLDKSEKTLSPLNKSVDTLKTFDSIDKATTFDKPVDTPTPPLVESVCILDDHKELTEKLKTDKEPLPNDSKEKKENTDLNLSTKNTPNKNSVTSEFKESNIVPKTNDKDQEIPLLNEPTVQPATKDVVSEIDILQALKNEILSETIALPCADVTTPALHQPKVTKVSNAQELPKKRISIEKYKQKSARPNKASLFVTDPTIALSKEDSKKQSLKLTEKEVERFNLISKIALDDSSDDDEKDQPAKSPKDLAPKSPDVEFLDDLSASPPVIIPVDPVKTTVVTSKVDVDMRKMPNMSPTPGFLASTSNKLEPKRPVSTDLKWPMQTVPHAPHVRRDKEPLLPTPLLPINLNMPQEPLPAPLMSLNLNMPSGMPPSMTPSMTPTRTPSRAPNMTPNARSFDVTPSRAFDGDEVARKHVYAPMYPSQDKFIARPPGWDSSGPSPVHTPNWEGSVPDREQSSGCKWDDRDHRSSYAHRDDGARSRIADSNHNNSYNRSRNDRYGRDDYSRQDGPQTPTYYGRSDCPATPTPSFGRGEAPATPTHYFGRSEAPMTPSHPFGRSEAPLTPSHPFGRSEGPLTPSHSFGMSEAPLTPSHPFGRSEASSTPSHPFGRGEAPLTPNHPFGRSDYSYKNPNTKYGKPQDPRLNRNYDNDPNTRRDHGSYNDRFKYNRNDPRNINREHSVGRTDGKPNNLDHISNREQMSRHETGNGHLMPKDNKKDRLHLKDRSDHENLKSYAEVGSKRTSQRESSVGRSLPDQRARASSVGRSFGKETDNRLSVKSNAGPTFTIDTSVNSTFQKFIDSHRQRASSVGRSLTRESSVGRTLPSGSYKTENSHRNQFIRAQSVGRDLSRAQSVGRDLKQRSRTEKSLTDIRAEFESYRVNDNIFKYEKTMPSRMNDNISNRDPRCRRNNYDNQHDITKSSNKIYDKEVNVPVKKFNYRDPRQRKEQKLRESSYTSNRYRSDSHDRHSYGISSDIVTKNPVINSVKNYKIPKIKRAPEEKPEISVVPTETKKNEAKPVEKDTKQKSAGVEKKVETKTKHDKQMTAEKSTKKHMSDEKNKLAVENSEKRVTRQSGKRSVVNQSSKQSDEDEIVVKTRKFKKVIYDSDSDENTRETIQTNKTGSPKKIPITKNSKSTNSNKIVEPQNENQVLDGKNEAKEFNQDKEVDENQEALDSSFGLDDIDLFSDNIITDPALDNISALIADLDSDLEAAKGESSCNDLFNEISIENMLEKITTSPDKPYNNKAITASPKSGTQTVRKDLFDSLKQSECHVLLNESVADDRNSKGNEIVNAYCNDVGNTDIIEKPSDLQEEPQSPVVSQTDDNHDAEPVVSTSVNLEENSKTDIDVEKNIEGRSTPDSTNDAITATNNASCESERLPDSTIEKQSEMNSDISSTHDAGDKQSKGPAEGPKDPATQIDSIGSLLSILQDKSKIKELLSMLGDHSSENDKIKKKLEKLSAIVSDDEDTHDSKVKEPEKIETLNEHQIEIENRQQDGKLELTLHEQLQNNTETRNDKKEDKSIENETNNQVENACDIKIQSTETEAVVTNNSQELTNILDQAENSSNANIAATLASDINDEPELGPVKEKRKILKRCKTGKFKKGRGGKKVFNKRVTRSEGAVFQFKEGTVKKPSRELRQLQESIKEMFMSDDILNASGIRMCRLAKMVDDKNSLQKDCSFINGSEPVVVLEKVKHGNEKESNFSDKPPRKKPGPKPKLKPVIPIVKELAEYGKPLVKHKPGPKSKTRLIHNEKDPYDFETDSLNESKANEKGSENSSDYESDSMESSKSFGSTELLVELKKKPKRKRPGWQAGVIKPKQKKRKVEVKRVESPPPSPEPERKITIPDINCFTDKRYCFSKNISNYSCRLCESAHSGADIVSHYKKHHPHSEIPLSRMSPATAKEAIEQCEEINFQAISKIPTEKYTCRFCYKEFARKRASLEAFFWHVVSMHTGEYKQLCSECINVTRCPFNLDIPAPPKDVKGQLIGYICGKCNFTQISLENLKMHVIVRHNDEQTEVYTINFAVMTKKAINNLVKRCSNENQPRVTRSSRSNQSLTEPSDDRSDITESEPEMPRVENKSDVSAVEPPRRFSFKSKITFETDDNASDVSNIAYTEGSAVKVEDDDEDDNQQDSNFDEPSMDATGTNQAENEFDQASEKHQVASNDIIDYPHFKIRYTDMGIKEYVCCINGTDNHYKTGLLISMKKHVQFKHSETWDGYCCVCKVIVTPQGQHKFSDCFLHFLDTHIDNFPVLEKVPEPKTKQTETPAETPEPPERASTPKNYINVRPLSELVNSSELPEEAPVALPVIENVVSLMPPTVETSHPSPTYPVLRNEIEPPKEYKYEEAQAEVMSKKHRVVLDAMMAPGKLVQVFKCAGRFCSFTADSAEDALMHASTHQRVGGSNALLCAYCDFDSSGNSIDLVAHVFKNHGRCQYVCGQCFYRAAASQLVGAHITRVHGAAPAQGRVLKASNATPTSDSTEGNLTRELAVPLYICKQTDHGDDCSFRTAAHSKFCDHLNQKHDAAAGLHCYMCSETYNDATSLVLHLKTHGLKLYHCTLCVFGADSELELLAHASARHPGKPPQAYIRTIRGMSNNGGFKILPLVELKKTALPSQEVAPNGTKENPVREAERSIELEKLIGDINVLDTTVESTAQPPEAEQSTTVTEIEHDVSNEVDDIMSNVLDSSAVAPMATLVPVPPLVPIRVSTPTTPITLTPAADLCLSKQLTPVLKEEPKDTTPEKPSADVICLDSDEEDSKQGIIDLSDDEAASATEKIISPELKKILTLKKIPPASIYKCEKCTMLCSTINGFKKHLQACYTMTDQLKCAHCAYSAVDINNLITHYNQGHGTPARYSCGLCSRSEAFLSVIKKHVKSHNVNKIVVTSKYGEFGDIQYVVGGNPDPPPPKPSKPAKRKPSTGSATPVTPTKRRYGPKDIDKLPINPILDESVHCDMCEFHTKVRLNMVRHLQLHAEQQPVPQTAPVNPVPHLETNEKHFDKMVNLASSSIVTRAPEKSVKEPTPSVFISPEMASRYPKYVPERHRHTCGAKGCSYISVDEGMLRRHWETLHSGTTDYHCVHCPPYQHLDKSKPLTANRIIAHLKMHDVRLYACSICPYYHYKRLVLEKHMSEMHKSTQVLVVREEAAAAAPATPSAAAPTMDLKPWQCGLCQFKHMLRAEVVEHCFKFHQSKMQYKCAYCPFRTSTPENVTKHQTSSHSNREHEIFYFYYREGSIPDAVDGTPLWQTQRQKTGVSTATEVKAEIPDATTQPTVSIMPQIQPQLASEAVNLNLVKQEVFDSDLNPVLESVEDLCKKFGEFCEPNGLNYKCSLCKVVVEDNEEAMQSHFFEELKYRKWGCRLCSYKAFHQTGLKEHMWTEHRQNQEPIELPVDINVEAWVSKQLKYQADLIKNNREKLAQQKIQVERTVAPSTSKAVEASTSTASKLTVKELEKYFGPLGTSSNMMYCCPKCQFKTKDEPAMQDHLEAELNKIRWCCSGCPNFFPTYHEAQFHCKSEHAARPARPVEAARDPALRAAWRAAALREQALAMRCGPVAAAPGPSAAPPAARHARDSTDSQEENSLLVVRYEENVPIPEQETARRKRPASVALDSDDDNLVIDEVAPKKSPPETDCPHCEFRTKYVKIISTHVLRHYNLKPFTCPYCEYNNYKPAVLQHVASEHGDKRVYATKTQKPSGPPLVLDLSKQTKKVAEDALVCLTCEKIFTDSESKRHVHDKVIPKFGKKGQVVVKCCDCLLLFPDVVAMQQHNTEIHSDSPINYAYYKLYYDTRDSMVCFHCSQRFSHMINLKSHHRAVHSSLKLRYTTIPYLVGTTENMGLDTTPNPKRKADDNNMITLSPKRCARKSTTKLPYSQAVAKKSTSKLPFYVDSDSESDEEYSYYGTRPPAWDNYSNVTTLMPFCNTLVEFTLKKLSQIIQLDPKVIVKDIMK